VNDSYRSRVSKDFNPSPPEKTVAATSEVPILIHTIGGTSSYSETYMDSFLASITDPQFAPRPHFSELAGHARVEGFQKTYGKPHSLRSVSVGQIAL
jgi:hypothetical protein